LQYTVQFATQFY